MIHLQNISKSFGKKVVLKNFSLKVRKGETVALLGLSGSGKTTALKAICGLHVPDGGEIIIDGLTLKPETLRSIRSKMGYVIQDGGLFPHLTARQNITVVGEEANFNKEEINARIERLARMTKIPLDLMDRYPRELSGGQRQRIGIMRALFLDPEILLMDEPMGALDPITRKELQDELKILFQTLEKTVVMVTHDLFEAMYLADRILLLSEGSVLQEGSMDDLLHKPATEFVSQFVKAQQHHGDV